MNYEDLITLVDHAQRVRDICGTMPLHPQTLLPRDEDVQRVLREFIEVHPYSPLKAYGLDQSDVINHAEAWDLAHHKRETSNLARCYIELRQKCQRVVDTYPLASGKVVTNGQDGYDPIRALRIICESSND